MLENISVLKSKTGLFKHGKTKALQRKAFTMVALPDFIIKKKKKKARDSTIRERLYKGSLLAAA